MFNLLVCLAQWISEINSYIASLALADSMISYKYCSDFLLYDIPGGQTLNGSLMFDFDHPNVAGGHAFRDRVLVFWCSMFFWSSLQIVYAQVACVTICCGHEALSFFGVPS
jgi:hypothetical protein